MYVRTYNIIESNAFCITTAAVYVIICVLATSSKGERQCSLKWIPMAYT